MLEIHVISSGALFREVFNAIVTLIGTDTFTTILRISALFAIISVALHYIKTRDILVLAKWFMLYFIVTTILLVPKSSVAIIDNTDEGATYHIDNVPVGIALPASLITSVSYALTRAFEGVFHSPDDLMYSKTGFLFGSHLFRLSTDFHLVSPEVKGNFNNYVKNCVIGDILINKKYSLNDLINSADIWQTISQSPSPLRGVYINNKFKSCKEVTPILKKEIDQDISNRGLELFGKHIFSGNDDILKNTLIAKFLPISYNYYANISKSATEIMNQNVMVNAMQESIINKAAANQATAALLNLSDTRAISQMRLAWGTSYSIAAYTLPLMQTIILLMLICMFPVMIILAIQPVIGILSLKNYTYSLIWVESWPLLYAAFNISFSFYIRERTAGLASGGLTLSNSNQLALMHSDIANMAGFMALSIPFIAYGLIKGMAGVFNTAASYIGSITTAASSSAALATADGNLSFGNMSYGNIGANKYDTNYTNFAGMRTMQLPSGATETITADGNTVYNTGSAISQLPIGLNVGTTLSESFTLAANQSKAAALTNLESYNENINSAASNLQRWSESDNYQRVFQDSYAKNQSSSFNQSYSDMHNAVEGYAKQEGINYNESFNRLFNINAGLSKDGHFNIKGFKGDIDGRAGINVSTSNEAGHSSSYNLTQTDDFIKQFREELNNIYNYSKGESFSINYSDANSLEHQITRDLTEAQSTLRSYSSNITESEQRSEMANFAKTNALTMQSNFAQGFVEYVKEHDQTRAETILTNTDSLHIADIRNMYAKSYMKQFAEAFNENYARQSAEINPDNQYQESVKDMQRSIDLKQEMDSVGSNIFPDGNKTLEMIKSKIETNQEGLDQIGKQMKAEYHVDKYQQKEIINEGEKKADPHIGGVVIQSFLAPKDPNEKD